MDISRLKGEIRGEVSTTDEALEEVSSDFGRIIVRLPKAVILPAGADDVVKIVQRANEEGWTLSIRGAGHSQSGQSLSEGGAVLDMQGLSSIGPVEGDRVWVDAGALWRDVVGDVLPQGWLPPVLTNNLNVTVGGTLSMAGLGVASHRYGTQADNVEELEVVTGNGEWVRCSFRENADLFNGCRAGLGQFAVITRVCLRLRPVQSRVRSYYLLYDDMNRLMADQILVMRQQRFDYIEGWCSPCPQGLRSVGETRVPFAEWFFPVHFSLEYSDHVPDEATLLDGLHYYRKVHVEDVSIRDFLFRLEPVFELWKQSGAWKMAHPWMELVLPWDRGGHYIQGVLRHFPPHLLVGGHVLLWPCRGTTSEIPLFMRPPGEFVMGFGILPAVPRQATEIARTLLNKASDLGVQLGGKRYLSGWVEFDVSQWREHFGPVWSKVLQWKRFYDPNRVLSPGFIQYPD